MFEHFGEARDIFGIVLVVVGFAWALPSVIHIFREKTASGMSLSSQILYVSFASSWVAYSIGVSSLVLLFSAISDVVCALALSIAVLRFSDRKNVVKQLWPLSVFVAFMLTMTAFGLEAFSAVFAVALCGRWLPQILESLRLLRAGADAHGVSTSGAVIGLAMCAGWFIWGLYPMVLPSVHGVDWPNVMWGFSGVVSFILQLSSKKPNTV